MTLSGGALAVLDSRYVGWAWRTLQGLSTDSSGIVALSPGLSVRIRRSSSSSRYIGSEAMTHPGGEFAVSGSGYVGREGRALQGLSGPCINFKRFDGSGSISKLRKRLGAVGGATDLVSTNRWKEAIFLTRSSSTAARCFRKIAGGTGNLV